MEQAVTPMFSGIDMGNQAANGLQAIPEGMGSASGAYTPGTLQNVQATISPYADTASSGILSNAGDVLDAAKKGYGIYEQSQQQQQPNQPAPQIQPIQPRPMLQVQPFSGLSMPRNGIDPRLLKIRPARLGGFN
jgi:hypothetical protein